MVHHILQKRAKTLRALAGDLVESSTFTPAFLRELLRQVHVAHAVVAVEPIGQTCDFVQGGFGFIVLFRLIILFAIAAVFGECFLEARPGQGIGSVSQPPASISCLATPRTKRSRPVINWLTCSCTA